MSNQPHWTDDQVEQTMGSLLRVGVILAAAVVSVGGVIYLVRHAHEVPDYRTFHSVPAPLHSITGTIESAASFQGQGIIQLGVLLLVATPVARVVLSVFAFAEQRDRRYVMVTLFVLAVLIFSLVHGYRDQSGSEKAGSEKAGSEKAGSEKAGSEKAGGDNATQMGVPEGNPRFAALGGRGLARGQSHALVQSPAARVGQRR